MSLKGACLRHKGRDLPVWELSGPRVPLQSQPTEPSRDQRCLHKEPCNAVCSPPKIKECQSKALTSVTCARTALAPKRPPPCSQIITAPSGAGLQQRGSWHVAGVCTPHRQTPYRHPPTKYFQTGDWAQDSDVTALHLGRGSASGPTHNMTSRGCSQARNTWPVGVAGAVLGSVNGNSTHFKLQT